MESAAPKLNTKTLEKILKIYANSITTLKSRDVVSVTSYLQNIASDLDYLFNYAVLKGEYYAKNALEIVTSIENAENSFLQFLKSAEFNRLVDEKIAAALPETVVKQGNDLRGLFAQSRKAIIDEDVKRKFIDSRETYSDHFYL